MLAPRLHRPEVVAPLAARWREAGRVRVADAFREAAAAGWLRALRGSEHRPLWRIDPRTGYQLWRFTWEPGEGCDHPLCELGRWLAGDGLAWIGALTGLALRPGPDRELLSDCAAKGSYYDAYDEGGAGRAVAFQVQLTASEWPAAWGGHMELLAGPDGPLLDRVAPAWNALDLYDVRRAGAWRRLPMIVKHLDGFTVSGWLDEAASAEP